MAYYSTRSIDFTKITRNPKNTLEVNVNYLMEILKIQSPSGEEELMANFIHDLIDDIDPNIEVQTDEIGNLYITKGKADAYPCLVAHMDEVHDRDMHREPLQVGDFIIGWNHKKGEQDGIGADDKIGIYVALEMLKEHDNIKLFFSVQEEVGCVGSARSDKTFFDDVTYLIQCDRRGYDDFISFTNGITVASDEFIYDLIDVLEDYGYSEASGTCTDIGALLNNGVKVSACNLSCGYFGEHSSEEKIYLPAMENCLNLVNQMLYTLGAKLYINDVEKAYKSVYSNYYDDWDYADYFKDKIAEEAEEEDDYKAYQQYWNDIPCNDCKDFDCKNCKFMR
jgi:putative aminopeptidase FrvX